MSILDDTRADWNARPPLRTRTTVPWSQRIGVSWHWIGPGKGPSATGPHTACLKQVRDWQLQHQAKGWKDVGYNVLICQHGRAIEGRGLSFSGSHSPGVNVEHVGIQFMVGDSSGPISPVMVARAQRLRADIGALGKNIRRDWGHRDDPKASTECPGNALYRWVHSGAPTAKPTRPTPTPTKETPVAANPKVPNYDGTQHGIETVQSLMRSDVCPNPLRGTPAGDENPYITFYQWMQATNATLARIEAKLNKETTS